MVDFGQNVVGSHHAENSVEGNGPVRCILVCVMNYFPYFYVWGGSKKCTLEWLELVNYFILGIFILILNHVFSDLIVCIYMVPSYMLLLF